MLLLNDTTLQMSVLRRIHFPFVKNEKLSNFPKLIDSLQLSKCVCVGVGVSGCGYVCVCSCTLHTENQNLQSMRKVRTFGWSLTSKTCLEVGLALRLGSRSGSRLGSRAG